MRCAGATLVALSDGSPELVVIGEMKRSFTLELVLQAVDRTSACDEVWLAVSASKRGRGRENDARVKKLCQFLGFGLLSVNTRGPGRGCGGADTMEAQARRQTAFAHRRGASSPQGGSRRGRFDSNTTDDRLSPAGASRGQRACRRAKSSARPSNTCSRRRQNPSGQRLWLVRADRAWTLRTDLVRTRRPGHMGQPCFR